MPRLLMRRTHRLGMTAVMGLDAYTRTQVPKRLLGLIQLRASQLNRCHYCIGLHTAALQKLGERPDRIEALAGEMSQDLFTGAELAALALTDEVTRLGDHGVSDRTWTRVSELFTPEETGNLVLAIAAINTWNRIAIATRLDD